VKPLEHFPIAECDCREYSLWGPVVHSPECLGIFVCNFICAHAGMLARKAPLSVAQQSEPDADSKHDNRDQTHNNGDERGCNLHFVSLFVA